MCWPLGRAARSDVWALLLRSGLITDEKLVESRFGPVRVQGRVVPIPGLGLPARAQFEFRFANRALADEFMQVGRRLGPS